MQRVFVGLSGGVDSAVSAYLLKKAGYAVTGVFLKVWEPDFLPCTAQDDRLQAMRVAAHLGIPFLTYNLEEEYKQGVVDYFVETYRKGSTPNPDVMCNRIIKFGAFWEQAQTDGAEMIATGHYAENTLFESRDSNTYALYRGTDTHKDQSYFLWTLTQEDLRHSLFPIGNLKKSEVRALAKEARLPNAERKDSQGLCFLGHVDMQEFLKHYIPVERGPVKAVDGTVLGEHDGVSFYTIGQRFPVAGSQRMFVIAKHVAENELIVAPRKHESGHHIHGEKGGRTILHLERVNWVREKPNPEKKYVVQIRYHGEEYKARIQVHSVHSDTPIAVAPGQSLVVYDPDTNECLGGGIISEYADHHKR